MTATYGVTTTTAITQTIKRALRTSAEPTRALKETARTTITPIFERKVNPVLTNSHA